MKEYRQLQIMKRKKMFCCGKIIPSYHTGRFENNEDIKEGKCGMEMLMASEKFVV